MTLGYFHPDEPAPPTHYQMPLRSYRLVVLGLALLGFCVVVVWRTPPGSFEKLPAAAAPAPASVAAIVTALETPTLLRPAHPAGFTRLSTSGVEFYDHWVPLAGEVAPEIKRQIYQGFGSDKVARNECKTNDPKRPAVAVRFAAHGFGQNLLQLANYILYAGLSGQVQLLFLEFNERPGANREDHHHAFQNWYEQHFSLVQPGTSCDVFHSQCTHVPGRCYDAYWEAPLPADQKKRDYWKQATWYMESYRRGSTHVQVHNLLKTGVIRELLRLQPSTKTELDRRHALALDGFQYDKQVAMHVRRTDKITGESRLVACDVFASALELVLNQTEFRDKRVLLHLMTDNATVLDEFTQAWQTKPLHNQVLVNFRFAGTRPDRTSHAMVQDSFYQILVDFRLMISADAFIGSQSSNLGVVACLLRVHRGCYTVEQPSPFVWDTAKDKIA